MSAANLNNSINSKYIDAHCHLNFADYNDDLAEVVGRMNQASVHGIVVGTTKETSRRAVELANQYDNLHAIIGLHPIYAGGYESVNGSPEVFDFDCYKSLASHPKVVGIGECGFDFFHCDYDTYNIQEKAFLGQIALANECGKPLMLHLRNRSSFEVNSPASKHDAYGRAIEILNKESKVPGDVHFYADTIEHAKAFLDLGFYISFTGVVTFVRAYDEIIRFVPDNRILSETDAPFVAPVPNRGKRNEPAWVVEIANKLAEVKGYAAGSSEKERFLGGIVENANRLFLTSK